MEAPIYMQRCPKCAMENWAPAVATGRCAWCGYYATVEDVGKPGVWVAKPEGGADGSG